MAKKIISEHKEQHEVIAKALLEYETLDEKQILSLYKTGKMPSQNEDEFPSEKATLLFFTERTNALKSNSLKFSSAMFNAFSSIKRSSVMFSEKDAR